MEEQFIRTRMLLGDEAIQRLQTSHVAVFGLGGVGSWCAEALCRSGVGELTLVDLDELSVSNINRQSFATHTCQLHPVAARYEAQTRDAFFNRPYDCIVDAIDLVSCKLDLIETAHARGIPMISAMGTGNKLDAQQLRIADLSKTHGCPLARIVRKELKARGILHHPVVFSPELPHRANDGSETPPPGRRSIPASSMWVPASAGLLLAQWVISLLSGVPKRP